MVAPDVIASVVAYSLCSGTMLVLNKLAIESVPDCPTMVSVIQLLSSTIIVLLFKFSGLIPVDDFVWSKVKPYLYYVVVFVLGVWSNMKSLEASNVDTVIVFRACTPIAVALMDVIFLGRESPSKRSLFALSCLVFGSMGYVYYDAEFALNGFSAYSWVTAYFVLICIEMTYGKKLVSTVKMDSVSGSVLYTNAFGWLPMFLIAKSARELEKFNAMEWTPSAIFFLSLSAIVGTGISYAGWWCRGKVSATTFTLVGVLNKTMTVLINVFIWDKHASPTGIFFLFVCLGGGSLYKQAPLRKSMEEGGLAMGDTTIDKADLDIEAKEALVTPKAMK